MIFLTFADQPSGVFSSQVVGVCKYLSELQEEPVHLVTFVSLRNYGKSRKIIRGMYPNSWVMPSFPGMKNWRRNSLLLAWVCRRIKGRGIFARGPLALNLALRMRQKGLIDKIGFDGRGAYDAEWNEYDVVPDEGLRKEIRKLEKKAVRQSDFRLAVSHALIDHWRKKYGYSGNAHVVVPCTLNDHFLQPLPPEAELNSLREKRGYTEGDIVLVYAGSSAGWQSFGLVDDFLTRELTREPRLKVLFLARVDVSTLACGQQFPDRVSQDWLPHQEVGAALAACDYGILIRDRKVTNEVASPTKFAEYLSRGLQILISEGIGDYSAKIAESGPGIVITENGQSPDWKRLSYDQKVVIAERAQQEFSKSAFEWQYKELLRGLNEAGRL